VGLFRASGNNAEIRDLGGIQQILQENGHGHNKQYYTAKKIWRILQQEGFTGETVCQF
jgi:hypothetical protein